MAPWSGPSNVVSLFSSMKSVKKIRRNKYTQLGIRCDQMFIVSLCINLRLLMHFLTEFVSCTYPSKINSLSCCHSLSSVQLTICISSAFFFAATALTTMLLARLLLFTTFIWMSFRSWMVTTVLLLTVLLALDLALIRGRCLSLGCVRNSLCTQSLKKKKSKNRLSLYDKSL